MQRRNSAAAEGRDIARRADSMTASSSGCWHCGEPLPANVVIHARIAGQSRPMCCHGCRAAAEWIEHLGLGDYYRLRTQPALKPDSNPTSGNRDAWQRPELARHVIRDLGAGCRETMLLVEGVRCAACVWLIERALRALPGVVSVQVNAAAQRARITWREATIYAAANSRPSRTDRLSRTSARCRNARRCAAARVTRRAQAIAGRGVRRDAGHDVRRGAVSRLIRPLCE